MLAIEAVKKGQCGTIKAAATAYDVPYSTLKHRLHGRSSRVDTSANCQRMTENQEASLKKWVYDMDRRGLPPTQRMLHEMANILLSDSGCTAPVGPNWVTRFIKRHKDLSSRYTRKYDYQRAQCENPDIIKNWFNLVKNTIEKYDIQEQDVYNFDESGFQMGVTSTAKVVTGAQHASSKVNSLQPGNREWVTIIECINATGWAPPPMVIFAGKVHQSTWYRELPRDWSIGLSNNGWTNNELGMTRLKDVFEKNTRQRAGGRCRLLILDGHGSHVTPEFDHFCRQNHIVPLYMPAHSSHLLQPLDVTCFAPLKQIYGNQIQKTMQNGVNHIDKSSFLQLYGQAHSQALSVNNICNGFKATGLIPLDAQTVLQKLNIHVNSTTPPTSPYIACDPLGKQNPTNDSRSS